MLLIKLFTKELTLTFIIIINFKTNFISNLATYNNKLFLTKKLALFINN